ncbi:prpD1 [Symbiodinium sp. CCMP2456]|nr:prpD1 [Symbiodinium sp. CCMP2456]
MADPKTTVTLAADSNQALGIAQYALDFIGGKYGDNIDASVWEKIEQFHTDSVMCGISALAMKCNSPTVLREEALSYKDDEGATVFGSKQKCAPEKAVVANSAAAREWDSNGTVFGYNPNIPGHQAGEFGHNDFYGVVIAAAQVTGKVTGKTALRAMICLDEIRGRLAEVFSLKSYKLDHVMHGAIASAAVYGALLGATAEEIESGIGMVVAHYVPFRAIRAGKQLSDSKGASAAISTEAAVLSMRRAMRGFVGPRDIFRNPESIFRFFEPTTGVTQNKDSIDITLGNKVRWGQGPSPFNLVLTHSGSDFAVCGMHFKIGLYEHQSAGALHGAVQLVADNEELCTKGLDSIEGISIVAYEPAFGIIGDPAKKDPKTRQSADHSMAFIVSRMLQKAVAKGKKPPSVQAAWNDLMLTPYDYGKDALHDATTRALMQKITFKHGGPEYDAKYPDGIPTSIDITMKGGKKLSSGLVMYPPGHARNTTADLKGLLATKNKMLGDLVFKDETSYKKFLEPLINMKNLPAAAMQDIYSFDFSDIREHKCIDGDLPVVPPLKSRL